MQYFKRHIAPYPTLPRATYFGLFAPGRNGLLTDSDDHTMAKWISANRVAAPSIASVRPGEKRVTAPQPLFSKRNTTIGQAVHYSDYAHMPPSHSGGKTLER